MIRTVLFTLILIFTALSSKGKSIVVNESPSEKIYADLSCLKVNKYNGVTTYQVAFTVIYTAIQSNGMKKYIFLKEYNSSWTQTRIIHQQCYNELGNLINWSDAIGNWYPIKSGTIGATMRDKVKIYF